MTVWLSTIHLMAEMMMSGTSNWANRLQLGSSVQGTLCKYYLVSTLTSFSSSLCSMCPCLTLLSMLSPMVPACTGTEWTSLIYWDGSDLRLTCGVSGALVRWPWVCCPAPAPCCRTAPGPGGEPDLPDLVPPPGAGQGPA